MAYHRVVRSLHRGLPLTVFWAFVGAFLLAFLFIFIHPVATILLLWLGLTSLGLLVALTHLLGAMRRTSARRILRRGGCPVCGMGVIEATSETRTDIDQDGAESLPELLCGACGAVFEAETGHEQESD